MFIPNVYGIEKERAYTHALKDLQNPNRLHISSGCIGRSQSVAMAYAEAIAILAAIELDVQSTLTPSDWRKFYGPVFAAREEEFGEEQGRTLPITTSTPISFTIKDGLARIALGANALKVPCGAALDGLINVLLSIRQAEETPTVTHNAGEWARLYDLDVVERSSAGAEDTDMTEAVMAWDGMCAFVPEEPSEADWLEYSDMCVDSARRPMMGQART